ncbi:hypothetical protein EG329_013251 [Mollisiaceae sp. DMI_Dod_QoI]|nr:hypothetical protein EG329_013251 [Helotiales sp. DMI_Dod_QoI]
MFLCDQPPNPSPYNSPHHDSLSHLVSPRAMLTRSFIIVSLGLYHAFLSLTYPSPPQSLCPNPSHLAPYLFTWTPHSAIAIITILLGSCIRLWAFSTLGKNFTFRLDAPKELITSGQYKYVQHPSYTGRILIALSAVALLMRPDASLGCWFPAWVVDATIFWRLMLGLMLVGLVRGTRKRVMEEESILKDTFGKEWEDWHKRTKRFIPGVF